MNAALLYVILVLAIVAVIGVVAAFLDRRRGRQIASDTSARTDQPDAARRDSPR